MGENFSFKIKTSLKIKFFLILFLMHAYIENTFSQYYMQSIMKNGTIQTLPVNEIDSVVFKDLSSIKYDDIPNTSVYNNIPLNRSKIGDFISKLKTKTVDQFNQLNIVLNGSSTFGRLSLNELSLTPDMNGYNDYGLNTGHFPPNMWQQIFAYKVLKNLQFSDADVKYYNLSAPEWKKQGFVKYVEIDNTAKWNGEKEYPQANCQITVSGVKFFKWIFSGWSWAYSAHKVEVSVDGGISWNKPSELGIGGFDRVITNFYCPDMKWGNVIFTLNVNTNYTFRFTNDTSYSPNMIVWGCETWSKPRVNVIDAAMGTSMADQLATRYSAISNPQYNQDLILVNMPYMNDHTTDEIKQQNYRNKLNDFFRLMKATKIPAIVFITHPNVFGDKDEYLQMQKIGRAICANSGYPIIDIDQALRIRDGLTPEQISKKYLADGVHLNDKGVSFYETEFMKIINTESVIPISSNYEPLIGNVQSSESRTVLFNIVFKKIPNITIFNNNTIIIKIVDNNGFTVVGEGSFSWKAEI